MLAMPAGLAALVEQYRNDVPKPVAYDLNQWESSLRDSPIGTKFLTDDRWSRRHSTPRRRVIDRRDLAVLIADTNFADPDSVCVAFALVTIWHAGVTNAPAHRHLPKALADPACADQLVTAVQRCRHGQIAEAYQGFEVDDLTSAEFTPWFAFAGQVPDRDWQPLILDDAVFKTLNDTLGVTTQAMAGVRDRGQRYAAYVAHLHAWSRELKRPCSPERLEWILSEHHGRSLPRIKPPF